MKKQIAILFLVVSATLFMVFGCNQETAHEEPRAMCRAVVWMSYSIR